MHVLIYFTKTELINEELILLLAQHISHQVPCNIFMNEHGGIWWNIFGLRINTEIKMIKINSDFISWSPVSFFSLNNSQFHHTSIQLIVPYISLGYHS